MKAAGRKNSEKGQLCWITLCAIKTVLASFTAIKMVLDLGTRHKERNRQGNIQREGVQKLLASLFPFNSHTSSPDPWHWPL